MLPFASCHSEGSGTDTITDYPALKVVVDHEEVSELWLWHGARPGENERQKASQSWATVTSVRKALVGQPNLSRMPRTRDHDVATGTQGMSDYWRSVRSDLSGHALVGYVNSFNAPTVAPAVSTPSFDAVATQIGLNYVLGRTLTDFILYTFSYENNGAVLTSGRAGDVTVNQFQFLLSKNF